MNVTPEDERYLRAKGAAILEQAVAPESIWAWGAYMVLRRSCHPETGVIPISEIASYCDITGITSPAQRHRLLIFVMSMNQTELKHNGRSEPNT